MTKGSTCVSAACAEHDVRHVPVGGRWTVRKVMSAVLQSIEASGIACIATRWDQDLTCPWSVHSSWFARKVGA